MMMKTALSALLSVAALNQPVSAGLLRGLLADPTYDVQVSVLDACLGGSVSATVTHNGTPVVGANLGFALIGSHEYTGDVATDDNGLATFEFTASPEDATGDELWCSIAVDNPSLPFSQQVPCSIKVCEQENRKLEGQEYNVEVTIQDACMDGFIHTIVTDAQGNPVVGTSVDFLLVGNSHYTGGETTDQDGHASFSFTAAPEDATGEDLWCSIAINNPNLPYVQQIPCSINVCKQERDLAIATPVCPEQRPSSHSECYLPEGTTCSYDKFACSDGSEHYTAFAICDGESWMIAMADIACPEPECPIQRPNSLSECPLTEGTTCSYDKIGCPDGSEHFTSFAICDGESWMVAMAGFVCPTHRDLEAEDPTYTVEVSTVDACPNGRVSATVKDAGGSPVVGVELSVLLVGNSQYSRGIVTDNMGEATFEFTAGSEDAGQDLWCSIAVNNPNMSGGNQQVPCSVSVCSDPYPEDGVL